MALMLNFRDTVLSVSLFFANTRGLNYVKNYLALRTEADELVVTYFGFKMH